MGFSSYDHVSHFGKERIDRVALPEREYLIRVSTILDINAEGGVAEKKKLDVPPRLVIKGGDRV